MTTEEILTLESNGIKDGDLVSWHKINELFPNGIRYAVSAKTMMDNEHGSYSMLHPDEMEAWINNPVSHPLLLDSDPNNWDKEEYTKSYNEAMESLNEHRKKIFYLYENKTLTEQSISQ